MKAFRLALCLAAFLALASVPVSLWGPSATGDWLAYLAFAIFGLCVWVIWEANLDRRRLRRSITARLHDLEKFQ